MFRDVQSTRDDVISPNLKSKMYCSLRCDLLAKENIFNQKYFLNIKNNVVYLRWKATVNTKLLKKTCCESRSKIFVEGLTVLAQYCSLRAFYASRPTNCCFDSETRHCLLRKRSLFRCRSSGFGPGENSPLHHIANWRNDL